VFGFTLSPSVAGHQITGKVPSVSTRPGRHVESPSDRTEAFSLLVVRQPSPGPTVASPGDPHRKLKLSSNVVAESKIS